jgi:hypothetical protein
MATYEYAFLRPYKLRSTDPDDAFEEEKLNELAADGWRVIHVLPSAESEAVLLLERERQDDNGRAIGNIR